MTTNDNTILYAATDAARGKQMAPPELLAQCAELVCGGCAVPVLALRKTLEETIALSQKHQRGFTILCPTCLEGNLANESPAVLYHNDPQILALLTKHQAERN